jgi:hypothetical protein
MTDRDEFPRRVVIQLAARAGHNCSNPNCRRPTSGPDSEQGTVNIGVAAHISAAAPGGPRFDSQLTSIERSAASNGIWLCQSCAKLIDSDPVNFTPDLLLSWKESSEARAQNGGSLPVQPELEKADSLSSFVATLDLRGMQVFLVAPIAILIGPVSVRYGPRSLLSTTPRVASPT